MMDSSDFTRNTKKEALLLAIKSHNDLMKEAKNGQGCDRHLFGLMCIAQDHDLPIPKLFSDHSYTASGGHYSPLSTKDN